MSRMLEAELHDVLLDISADALDTDEQAKIIAQAAHVFRLAEGKTLKRQAKSKAGADQIREAAIMDALMQAMNRVADFNADDDDFDGMLLDADSLDPSQIVRQVECGKRTFSSFSVANAGYGKNLDVVDDDSLDFLLHPNLEGHSADDYEIEDGQERHCPKLYRKPGLGGHRSDSLSR